MASVRRLQPLVQERVDVLLRRVKDFGATGRVLNASCMFAALTNGRSLMGTSCTIEICLTDERRCGETVTRSLDAIIDWVSTPSSPNLDRILTEAAEDPNFDPWGRDAALAGANSGAFMKHAPWIDDVLQHLPDPVLLRLLPAFSTFMAQKRSSKAHVQEIIDGENEDWRGREYPTIFHSVLDFKLPPEEKSVARLADDAQMFVMAGTLTTSSTFEVIHFWLLSQPNTLQQLKDELSAAIPNPDDVGHVPLSSLETLPYLTAVIKEGLRLSYGVSTRLQRIDPDNTLMFTDKNTGEQWPIPAGTPVGSTSVLIHHDESIYPKSKQFSPERWLDGKGPGLEQYLVSFGAGSRRCFGENLAYAELYLGLAGIWRLWGSCDDSGARTAWGRDDVGAMSLWETGVRDVEMESEELVPMTYKGSQGVRVKVWHARLD